MILACAIWVTLLSGGPLAGQSNPDILTGEPVPGRPGLYRWPDGEEFVSSSPPDATREAVPAAEARLRRLIQGVFAWPLTFDGFLLERPKLTSYTYETGRRQALMSRAGRPLGRLRHPYHGPTATISVTGANRLREQLTLVITATGSPRQAKNILENEIGTDGGPVQPVRANGAPSGLSFGQFVRPLVSPPAAQEVRLAAVSENLMVWVTLEPPPGKAAKAPGSAVVASLEHVARLALARAQAASAGLVRGNLRDGGRLRIAKGVRYAGVANQGVIWRGTLSVRIGRNKVDAPLSGYEIRVNNRPVRLRHPVMEADGQIWIEASALPNR